MKLKTLAAILATATSLTGVVSPAFANPTSFEEMTDFYHNARAGELCDDVDLGYNTQDNSGSRHSSQSDSISRGGGGGFKIFGVSANANGHRTSSESTSNNNQWDRDRTTLVTGRNCSVNSTNMSHIIMNQQDNDTRRYLGSVEERMNQTNNDTQRYVFQGSMRRDRLTNMFQY